MVDPTRDRTGAAAADLPRYSNNRKELELNMHDVGDMIILVSSLDPNRWTSPEAKSMIYKCKSAVRVEPNKTGDTYVLSATIVVRGSGK